MSLRPVVVGSAGALLLTLACYDFDSSLARCKEPDGRCTPPALAPDPNCVPSGPDVPDDGFVDSDCDGVDGEAAAGIFVDPSVGDDQALGTAAAPMRTLAAALQRAQGAGKTVLFLSPGPFNEAELTLAQPISLHGGYAGRMGSWVRQGASAAHLDGGSIGLTVRDVDGGVVLDRLLVSSSTPQTPGAPSIALRVLRAGVTVRRSELSAGSGAAGSAGAAGEPGAPGAAGSDGGAGSDSGRAGAGAQNACAAGPGLSVGGRGGLGAEQSTPGGQGLSGLLNDAPVSRGGDGGQPTQMAKCGALATCACTGAPGLPGTPGAPGARGADGRGGEGLGSLAADSWQPAVAEAGTAASEAGAPGGGGGGGGGCFQPDDNPATGKGGGGGGGGAGGCPGGGGGGGQGGGASIALLAFDSHVTLDSSTLRTAGGAPGGAGGAGGDGGVGGPGGTGGVGAAVEDSVGVLPAKYQTDGGVGGTGGPGGQGGSGGHGGGGLGGPSVGMWCNADAGVTTTGELVIQRGPGGPGGGGPGREGDRGAELDAVGCGP